MLCGNDYAHKGHLRNTWTFMCLWASRGYTKFQAATLGTGRGLHKNPGVNKAQDTPLFYSQMLLTQAHHPLVLSPGQNLRNLSLHPFPHCLLAKPCPWATSAFLPSLSSQALQWLPSPSCKWCAYFVTLTDFPAHSKAPGCSLTSPEASRAQKLKLVCVLGGHSPWHSTSFARCLMVIAGCFRVNRIRHISVWRPYSCWPRTRARITTAFWEDSG